MNQSEQINELATALSKAQAIILPAIKDSTNPFFKSKYADLSSVWSACRDALTQNGLAVLQTMDSTAGQLMLLTTLAHSSGQWIRSCLPILSAKQDAQSLGSAITYMRRYSLAAIVGVTTDEDDDGNAAQGNRENKNHPKEIPSQTPITKEQCAELESLIALCDKTFQMNYMAHLKAPFDQLPSNLYDHVKKTISSRIPKDKLAHV